MKTLPICTLVLFLLLWLTPVTNLSFLQPTPALAQSTIPDRLSNVTQVAVGNGYTCAITTNNSVNCWGQTNSVSTMQELHSNVTAISVNGFRNCALTSSHRAVCWGSNTGASDGTRTEVDGVTAISTGYAHSCAITTSGGALCWGRNEHGQLGDGTYENRERPVAVHGLSSNVIAISAGLVHTCALTTGGGVFCWGFNYNKLDDGTFETTNRPMAVEGLSRDVTTISASHTHTCAVTSDHRLFCWGANYSGQLGDDATQTTNTPVAVPGLSNDIAAVSAGWFHTCAVTASGDALCWGQNRFGQLGDGTNINKSKPVFVQSLHSGVTTISAGDSHTCAITINNTVTCWGHNSAGQLGNGAIIQKNRPVAVQGLPSAVTTISAGDNHTCTLTDSGGALCWGNNGSGELGDGTYEAQNSAGATSPIASGMIAISAGGGHTCALTGDNSALCWGGNLYGQLGDGSTSKKNRPVAVSGLQSGVTAISSGMWHTCALTNNGGTLCWGNGTGGQLGNGAYQDKNTPVVVQGLSQGVVAISAGFDHTCALTISDGVLCWGRNNYGQLGDGTTAPYNTPVAVKGAKSSDVTAISAGSWHTCALISNGSVFCWGENFSGQLGDGTYEPMNIPVPVQGLSSRVIAISAGTWHTCALTDVGGVFCWGDNRRGQLGDGTGDTRNRAVAVQGLSSGVTAISTGHSHTCAVTISGDLLCWGDNDSGQLGDGTAWSTTPVDVVAGWQTQHYLPLLFK